MLTYQLQKRYYVKENGMDFSFPNTVEVEIELEPKEMFGVGNKPSKTAVHCSEAEVIFDANTGKCRIRSNPSLEPINAILEVDGLQLEMIGNKLYAKATCENHKILDDLLVALHYIVPILINIEFAEPPIVKLTRGKVGDIPFQWELRNTLHQFYITTKEIQEQRVIGSLNRLITISDLSNRRLAAALYHFYVARRLEEAGNSPYEFMSEIILNLYKILEILIGPSRDKVRDELSKFGYSKDEIDFKFIPIMLLRNEFDVGHVSIALFTQTQLDTLYSYLEKTQNDFRDLLKIIINKVEDGSYSLKNDSDLKPDEDKLRTINRWFSLTSCG
ncbi:MAG: hypothetical protein JW866_01530 [Ignavibacteriales bacterium]|nr:hypothetical protein [Ignavibacteriales bacterium]